MTGSIGSSTPPAGLDLAGGVVRLIHSRGVAKAQLAAAERILDTSELTHLGLAADRAADPILRSVRATAGQHLDALAALATGLGGSLDVYA